MPQGDDSGDNPYFVTLLAIGILANLLLAGFYLDSTVNVEEPPEDDGPVLAAAPEVYLSEPANNSLVNVTAINLSWQGFDADGDELTYEVELGLQGHPLVNLRTTKQSHWRAIDLLPGLTYQWRITASDGENTVVSKTFYFRVDYTPIARSMMVQMSLADKVGQMLMGKTRQSDSTLNEVENITF